MQTKHFVASIIGVALLWYGCSILVDEYRSVRAKIELAESRISDESTKTMQSIRSVTDSVKGLADSISSILSRLAAAESRMDSVPAQTVVDEDRFVAVETNMRLQLEDAIKGMTCPPSQTVDLSPIEERLAALEAKLLALVPTEKPKENTTVSALEKPRIVMHAGENCPPCKLWKANELPKWIKAGWEFDVIDETVSQKRWPWFEVYGVTAEPFEVEGYMTRDVFEAVKARVTK